MCWSVTGDLGEPRPAVDVRVSRRPRCAERESGGSARRRSCDRRLAAARAADVVHADTLTGRLADAPLRQSGHRRTEPSARRPDPDRCVEVEAGRQREAGIRPGQRSACQRREALPVLDHVEV